MFKQKPKYLKYGKNNDQPTVEVGGGTLHYVTSKGILHVTSDISPHTLPTIQMLFIGQRSNVLFDLADNMSVDHKCKMGGP